MTQSDCSHDNAVLKYLEGRAIPPTVPSLEPTATADEIKVRDEALENYEDYLTKEGEAIFIILSSIPESIQIRVLTVDTSKDMWQIVSDEYERRMRVYSMDLCRRLKDLRYDEAQDVREHFAQVVGMKEELAAMGQSISDEDFITIIINSLPTTYGNVITVLYAVSQTTKTNLKSFDLISAVEDEYGRRLIQSGSQPGASAFATKPVKDVKKKKGRVQCTDTECRKLGHTIENCWKKGGGKAGQGPRQH